MILDKILSLVLIQLCNKGAWNALTETSATVKDSLMCKRSCVTLLSVFASPFRSYLLGATFFEKEEAVLSRTDNC